MYFLKQLKLIHQVLLKVMVQLCSKFQEGFIKILSYLALLFLSRSFARKVSWSCANRQFLLLSAESIVEQNILMFSDWMVVLTSRLDKKATTLSELQEGTEAIKK